MALGKVLDPTASNDHDDPSPGPDAGHLVGKRIGFRIDQIWRSWDWIADIWAEKLREMGAEVSFWRSCGRSGAEGETMNAELKAWLGTIDMAIVGLANCGSCTGWTIRDAIASANSGIATVAVATKNFEEFAHVMAARGGRSGLRVHVLPYPLNECERADVDRVASDYFNGLLQVIGARQMAQMSAA